MMTNEKAKEIGRRLLLHFEGEEKEAMETLLDANEKQIPKIFTMLDNCGNETCTERCPECFEIVNAIRNYCPECGQRIDWSEA